MNKAQFVENAPAYYALAIGAYFTSRGWAAASGEDIERFYTVNQDKDDEYQYLGVAILFDEAIRWLIAHNILEEIDGGFGPSIYSATSTSNQAWNDISEHAGTPFQNYLRLQGEGRSTWLHRALENVNEKFIELNMSVMDFISPGPPDIEWEPIPLDRGESELQNAIEAIDETLGLIRGDNGYAAEVPEERKYVLTTLSDASKRLKEDTEISISWTKRTIIEPLTLLIRRFGRAALGLAASVAKEAFKEWLRKKGITFLDSYLE